MDQYQQTNTVLPVILPKLSFTKMQAYLMSLLSEKEMNHVSIIFVNSCSSLVYSIRRSFEFPARYWIYATG